jgi:signal transduction histidine kinase
MNTASAEPAVATGPARRPLAAANRYQAILHGMAQGFCLIEGLVDAGGAIVDYRILEANAAFAKQNNLDNPVGRTMRELAPWHGASWCQLYSEVVRTGQPAHFEQPAQLGDGDSWYEVNALPSGPPGSRQLAVFFTDITARRHTEEALRSSQNRQAFLLRLADALRPLAAPTAIAEVACRLLLGQLAASRVQYTLVEGEPGAELGWAWNGSSPRPTDRFALASYGEPLIARLRANETLVLSDAGHDPQLTTAQREAFLAVESSALIAVPLVKEGLLVAVLTVHAAAPRPWAAHEVRLVEEVAERTWAAIERARAADILRKLEEQFRLFVTTSSDIVYQLSADWQQLRHLNGKSFLADTADTAASPANWLDTYSIPDDRPGVEEAIQAAIASRRFFELEHRAFRADGSVGWMFSRAVPVFGAQGELAAWFGTATDITTRKLAEEALRQSEQQLAEFNQHLEQVVAARTHELREGRDLLQSVFDTNLLALSVMRTLRNEAGEVQDFCICLVNKQLEYETGRTDLVGKYYLQEYPGVRLAGILDLMLQTLATGEPQGMEYYYNHEGFDQWFSCMFIKLGDGLVATSLDITQRKVAEQDRTRNFQLLEQAENVAQLGSWDYDLATGQFQWSAGMYHLFGLPLGQPVRPSIYLDYVVAEDRALAEQLVHHLTTAVAGDFEQTLRLRVGGQVKTVRTKAVVFPGVPGQPIRTLGVDLDISELHRLEADNLHLRLSQQKALFEAMQEAQEEERRRMSESLHNGIGQLLYATKLQLDRLPDAPAQSPRHEAGRLLSEAMRQTRSLSHELTPALLEEFGLEATLHSVCRALSQPTLSWHCHLVFEEGPALPLSLQLAVYRLAQELTQNVVKHAQASQATLEAEVLPAWVVLRIEDDGCGFDPTHTSDGLGLRSLRSRVALLGGRMHLTTAPGQGTQCQICLPLTPSAL